MPLVRERIKRLDELIPATEFFFSGDLDYAPVAEGVWRRRAGRPRTSSDALLDVRRGARRARDFSSAGLEALARAFAEKTGWKTKELFMLLRLAVTGKKATPPLFETLAGLGRELMRRRIRLRRVRQKDAGPQGLSRPGAEIDVSSGALRAGDPLGVYVHFPFCACAARTATSPSTRARRSRTTPTPTRSSPSSRRAARWFDGAGPLVSIYFGGGTPGLWRPDALGRVIEAARVDFGSPPAADLEITVEANPGEIDAAQLRALRAEGVNRLSIGIQAFEDWLLRALGRNHDAAAIRPPSARRARPASTTSRSISSSVCRANRATTGAARSTPPSPSRPTHVSAYALTIERGTVFGARDRAGRAPAPRRRSRRGDVRTRARGARRRRPAAYEVSSYARPGRRARHNHLYWSGAPYLGVGASAASLPPARRRERAGASRTRARPTST